MSHPLSFAARSPRSAHLFSQPSSRTRSTSTLRTAALALVIGAASLAFAGVARAQGFPGGGMGGMGGGGRRGGMGRGGDQGGQGMRGPNSADFAKQFEEMASLKKALDKVPDLSGQQKDSLKKIEHGYGEIFKSYGIAARNKVDSARAAGSDFDLEPIRALRQAADSVQTAELGLARGVLTTDVQRARFDQNVTDIHDEAAKREDEMRNRRTRGAGRGAGMGAGMPPR